MSCPESTDGLDSDGNPKNSNTVTVSGTYYLNINSTIPQKSVSIEAYAQQEGTELIAKTEANLTDKTWSIKIPKEAEEVWFGIKVTDNTNYTFGKIVSKSAQSFKVNTADINLVLGPYIPPLLTEFSLIDANAVGGVKQDKTGTINQETGVISFENTCFTTLRVDTIIEFYKLAANFSISDKCRIFVGNTEQISGETTNNYYNNITFTVTGEDNAKKTYKIAGQVLDVDSSASGASNETAVNRVVGTSSWQTQGFGIMIIDTVDKTIGLPAGDPNPNTIKLNNVWNPTGSYTYISPAGRVTSGGTNIRGRGNYSLRHNPNKSYNLKLDTAASFDYYDYKTKQYIQLPAHRRWGLLAHQADVTRIKTTLGFEMGRQVLTNMGWHPHGECVFFFLNGTYKGMYILTEIIKPEAGRHGITPLVSAANPNGGWMVEINNSYFYYHEGSNYYTFDELYSFMSSHQNPVDNRQQGIVWSFKEPDSNLGWYFTEPPDGDGFLSFSNPAHAGFFPRKGILLMATLGTGTAYNRKSSPAANWIVPNDFGQTNGIGSPGLLRSGSIGQNNGGIYGDRTLGEVYTRYDNSTFVKVAQFLQDAEDAVYSHDWLEKGYGKGTYLNYIDIDSFIDWQIGKEMCADWELAALNGHHAYFDPKIGKLKMGPMWDLDQQWQGSSVSRGCSPGFVGKTAFWHKELLGWEITGNNGNSISPGQPRTGVNGNEKDQYYVDRLKARWNEVSGQFADLHNYIDAQDRRFDRIKDFNNTNNSSPANGASTGGVPIPFLPTTSSTATRASLKSPITLRSGTLTPVFNGY